MMYPYGTPCMAWTGWSWIGAIYREHRAGLHYVCIRGRIIPVTQVRRAD